MLKRTPEAYSFPYYCKNQARWITGLVLSTVTAGFILLDALGAPPEYVLIAPTTVNAAGQTLQLPSGQPVTLIAVSNGNATIRVTLPGGALSIAQIPAVLLRQQTARPTPATAVTKTAATPSATSEPIPPASTQPTPAPTPAQTPSSRPGAVNSQFSLNPGTSSNKPARDGSKEIHKNWKLVWSDDFKETSIDPQKWGFEVNGNGGGNGEKQFYTANPKNAHITNGHLVITAVKEQYQKHEFTSARMTTKGKGAWKYGRFEAKIKFPKGKGLWPAFWLMPEAGVYGGWPLSGEIDIAEVIGDKPNILYGTIHYGNKWPHNEHTGDKIPLPSGDFSSDFHVVAVEWEEGEIRWYLDGKLYQTQTSWHTAGGSFPAPFDQKFFIILNVAVGGAWPGPPDKTTVFPQTMEVEYVRVYQPG